MPVGEGDKVVQCTAGTVMQVIERKLFEGAPVLVLLGEGDGQKVHCNIERLLVLNFTYYLCLRVQGESQDERYVAEVLNARSLRLVDPETFLEVNMETKGPEGLDTMALARLLGEFTDENARQSMNEIVGRGRRGAKPRSK